MSNTVNSTTQANRIRKDEEIAFIDTNNVEDNNTSSGTKVDISLNSELPEVFLNNLVKPQCRKSSDNTNKSKWRKFCGVLFALLAAFFFSLVHCFVKLLTNHHAFSISFWRQFGNIVPSIPLVLYYRYFKREPVFDEIWPITSKDNRKIVTGLALRGFLGSSCVILRFYALDFLSVADSATLMYSGPLFIIALGHVFLKEPCGVVPVLTAIWSLLGACVITRPPLLTGGTGFDSRVLLGTGIILIVVLFQGFVTILIRKVRKVHFAVMTLIFGVWGLVQSGLVSLSFGVLSVPITAEDILFTTLLALCAFFGQICAILSLKFEEAGVVSLCRTSDVIFAFILQGIILDVEADIFSFIGAVIVLLGVIVTACRKYVGTLNEKSVTRRKLKFLLK